MPCAMKDKRACKDIADCYFDVETNNHNVSHCIQSLSLSTYIYVLHAYLRLSLFIYIYIYYYTCVYI